MVIQSGVWNERLNIKDMNRSFDKLSNSITQDVIDDVVEIRASFMQKTDIYKTVYDSMDYYSYNAEYVKGNAEQYKKEVGAVEKANIKLVELYYETTLVDYIGAIKTLKVGK